MAAKTKQLLDPFLSRLREAIQELEDAFISAKQISARQLQQTVGGK
jgi:hypothetical protein